jgi:hypothetical protein
MDHQEYRPEWLTEDAEFPPLWTPTFAKGLPGRVLLAISSSRSAGVQNLGKRTPRRKDFRILPGTDRSS